VRATTTIAALAGSFALSAALTPLLRRFAHRVGLLAQPHSERWRAEAVPVLGGYAMFAACSVATLLTGPRAELGALFLGAGLMFALGALDDLRHFRPATKLVAQIVIAAVVVSLLPRAQITGLLTLDALLSVLWIVGITNAFNLLDNIDGLSAGTAAIAGLSYMAVLGPLGPHPLMPALGGLVGAALGFLIYNVRPASIFMGDSGSLFLGSFLAGAALLAAPALSPGVVPVAAIPLFILLVPIFDTVFVSVTRRMAGRSPMLGGRDHLSHRLVALGVDEQRAVLWLYALAALGGVIAVTLQHAEFGYAAILIALYLIVLAWVGIVLGHVEAHAPAGDGATPPLVSEVHYKNRVYEVLLDIALIALAYYAAFRFRFRTDQIGEFIRPFATSFPLVIACQIAGLAVAGKYRQVWRSIGATELLIMAKGIGMGVAGSVLLMLGLYRFERFSRLVFAIDAGLLLFLLVAARLAATSVDEHLRNRRGRGRPVLVYGAGVGGALLVRVLLEDSSLGLTPVGFVDDDPTKRRLRLEGVPVLGGFEQLETLLASRGIAEVLISVRALDRTRLAEVAALCRRRGVAVRAMRFALDEIGPVATIRHAAGR
jgi:UDP-GlcNAc:undecaprenyl-phosphate/decaprenyl-phosphate GlcNAc-1-phosphate transferase